MDKSLQDYLNQADQIMDYMEKYFIVLNVKQIEEKITELQSSIKTIQTVAYKLANTSNLITRALRKKHMDRNEFHKPIDVIDPKPNDSSLGILQVLNPLESKEIIKGVSIPITIVDKLQDIPTAKIYYIKEFKQYAMNINGVVIRGNIGNIVEYQSEHSTYCDYGIYCKSLKNNKTCNYYHDPTDYIDLKIPVPNIKKNFTVGSWLYSQTKTPRTHYTRHIGSYDKLAHDLNTIKKTQFREELQNRECQLMHDLLIYMILVSRCLSDKYRPWKKMPIK